MKIYPQISRHGLARIFIVIIPLRGIGFDVTPNVVNFTFVADDVFLIIVLPDRRSFKCGNFPSPFFYPWFKLGNDHAHDAGFGLRDWGDPRMPSVVRIGKGVLPALALVKSWRVAPKVSRKIKIPCTWFGMTIYAPNSTYRNRFGKSNHSHWTIFPNSFNTMISFSIFPNRHSRWCVTTITEYAPACDAFPDQKPCLHPFYFASHNMRHSSMLKVSARRM